MFSAVPFVDVLDDLFTPIGLNVDIDVGRAVTLGGKEPFEQQPERHSIGISDAEGVTDRRVRGRPPPLTVDI